MESSDQLITHAIVKAFFSALVLVSIASPVLARDGEVFFRKKGRVDVGPGTQLELVNCDGSHDRDGNSDGGVTCSIKVINSNETPYRTEQQ